MFGFDIDMDLLSPLVPLCLSAATSIQKAMPRRVSCMALLRVWVLSVVALSLKVAAVSKEQRRQQDYGTQALSVSQLRIVVMRLRLFCRGELFDIAVL
jgi:hypothetical protein